MSWLSGRALAAWAETLGSTPGGATFLSSLLLFQRSTDSDGDSDIAPLTGRWHI